MRRGNNNAKLLHDFGVYKQKLQENGVINSIDQQVYAEGDTDTATTDSNHRTYELSMLQLMPTLIEELRHGRIEAADQSMLHALFGKLWDAMVDEAEASAATGNDDGNDDAADGGDLVLAGILRAVQELEANGRLQAVIESSVVPVTDVRFANLWHRSAADAEEPSQRILKLAAVLMQAHVEAKGPA